MPASAIPILRKNNDNPDQNIRPGTGTRISGATRAGPH
jgi:hypothetical protein